MAEWTRLGPVVRTQIHTDRMVDDGRYHHDLIVEADELWLGPDGVIGQVDGRSVLHGHHRLHPNKTRAENPKGYRPNRLLSFGFTGHYTLMADRFGAAPVGCAAEDVIVEHAGQVTLDMLSGGLEVRRGERSIAFEGVAVAKPCVPFTKYLLDDQDADDDTVAPNRAFLEAGMRGFIVGLANHTDLVDVRVGDEVWARSATS